LRKKTVVVTGRAGSDKDTQMRAGWAQRLKVWLLSSLGYLVIKSIGLTLRWEVQGWENYRAIGTAGKKAIHTFWHEGIFLGTYFWRNRGIVVMTSQHADGDYIARAIRRFGYGAARGSSTRGARHALVEMIREMDEGHEVAFAIDGPRGPRHIVKPGAVWIASRTGNAVFPFSMSARHKWTLPSWDRFQIPVPFSRALILIGAPIWVEAGATAEGLERARQQVQQVLDDLDDQCKSYWKEAGNQRIREDRQPGF
jgi:lysophospholipid acyltransferase (LPLAT)-like uncharacterized protein